MDGLEPSPIWGLFGIVIGLLIYFCIKKNRLKINLFFYILFCYYIARTLSITLLPLPLSDLAKEMYMHQTIPMINFIPLDGITHLDNIVIKQWILNIIMLMPFGFFIPLTFKSHFSFKKILFLSIAFSLFIEISQLCISYLWIGNGYRLCDINDLIFNTLGGLIGYFICSLFIKLVQKKNIKI